MAADNRPLLDSLQSTLGTIESIRTTLGTMEVALDSILDAIVVTDGGGRVQWANAPFARVVGRQPAQVQGAALTDLLPLAQEGTAVRVEAHPVHLILNSGFESTGTYEFRHGETLRCLDVSGARIHVNEGEQGAVLTIRDISEQKRVHARLEELAHFDPLTGLPNRRLFLSLLAQAVARARRANRALALLFIDLDHFKLVNDTLGHSMGDLLLQAVPQRLAGSLRISDTLARLGGDELTVILEEIQSPDEVAGIVRRLQDALVPPFPLGGHVIHLTCSIGVALFPGDATDESALVKCADTAMYAAKEHRGTVQFYSPVLHQKGMERMAIENGLRLALTRHELVLHYQPIVNPSDRRIVAVEALLRWHHPERGVLLPNAFIAIAEETRLIVPIGEWVLRTACAQAKAWQAMGVPYLRLAVNIAFPQLEERDFVGVVTRILRDTGLEPACLELELTERLFVQDDAHIKATLQALSQMGVHLAIDDFGTEYSSLGYLRRFPFTTLKIDQSFVQQIPTNAEDVSIVKALVALGHCLHLKVIAEGVETEEQAVFLQGQRCHEMQGYHFSRAVPAEELVKLMREARLAGGGGPTVPPSGLPQLAGL